MTDRLPPNLLKLFAPRPPMPYLAPMDRDEDERTGPVISGIASALKFLDEEKKREFKPTETIDQWRERKMKERAELCHMTLQNRAQNWKPNENPNATSDPFKTLIVARLAYDVTESDLRKELEYYGPLKKIKMVQNKETNEPRGYAFVEFEREKDMKAAYHEADGVRLRGKRILIDVERGRTVKDWKPRSLGGGLGYTRKGKKEENQKNSGRAREPAAPRERERDSYDGHRERERRRSRSPYGSRNRERNYDRYRENRYHDRDSHRPPPRDYDRPREYEHGYYRR